MGTRKPSLARFGSLILPKAVFVVVMSSTIDGRCQLGTAMAMRLVLSSTSVPPHGGRCQFRGSFHNQMAQAVVSYQLCRNRQLSLESK
jgi:hypothetical protein